MRLVQHLTALAALGLAFASARSALAACTTHAECGAGFACEVVGESGGCMSMPCTPDGVCPDPICEPTVVEKDCVPASCGSNADCPADMICYAVDTAECDNPPPCATPGDCLEPTCVPDIERRCLPNWVLPLLSPCTADADCGTGFRCSAESAVDCDCAEPVPVAPATGGAAGVPVPVGGTGGASCVCEVDPAAERYCEFVPQGCTTSDTCPAGWTCEANPMESDCAVSSGGSAPGIGGAASMDPMPVEPCPSPDPAMVCLPPYAMQLGDLETGGGSDSDDDGLPVSGGAGTGPTPPTATGGSPTGTSAGTAGTSAPANPDERGESGEEESASSSGDDGGCQMAPAAGGLGHPLTGLLAGLALLGVRRRRRA